MTGRANRVLVACERSGTIREAFAARGWEATSVDVLPTTCPTGRGAAHIIGDALDYVDLDGWDLIIARPPCTYLANSGVRWLKTDPSRWDDLRAGAEFFLRMLNGNAEHVAVENPVMHRYALELVGRRADQYVQPWQFGHPEQKRTGFWLRGLPKLIETENVREHMLTLPAAERHRTHYAAPGEDRWEKRSLLVAGLAEAMAAQWGEFVRAAQR